MKLPEFWKTGLLFLVAAALVSYIVLVERKQEVKPEGQREKVPLVSVDKAKAKSLTLAAEGSPTIELVRDGGGWRLTAPFAAPADASAVDSMLGSLEKLEADEVVAERAADLAQYGLAAPKRVVTALVEGAQQPLAVQFGAKSPDGSTVYAKKPASSTVYLVPTWVESAFDKKPFDLRDRDLLHVRRDDVRSLEVGAPEGGYALARTDAGEWAFTKPLATRAGRWAVDGLLGTIENLRMESVAVENATPAELVRYGLTTPARSVTLVTADGQTHTLQLGAAAPDPAASPSPLPSPAAKGKPPEPPKPTKYYARQAGSGLVAVVPATLADDLAKGMGELRAKRLLEIATYETDGFETVAGGVKKTYERTSTKDKDGFEKSQWKRTAPDKKDLDTTKVEDALFKMGGVEVAEFVDAPQAPASYGLDAPLLKVSVKAKTPSWIEVGRKDGAWYARRSNDSAVLKIDSAKAEELVKAFAEL